MATGFLNVDLEVRSNRNLTPLVEIFEKKGIVLYKGRVKGANFASFEASLIHKSLGQALNKICDVADSLPPRALQIWKSCKSRVFDIGFDASGFLPTLRPYNFEIEEKTCRRIAKVGGSINITIYSIPKNRRKKL